MNYSKVDFNFIYEKLWKMNEKCEEPTLVVKCKVVSEGCSSCNGWADVLCGQYLVLVAKVGTILANWLQ